MQYSQYEQIGAKMQRKMKVAIRVDSSTVIGSGHLMRCLTFAERMRREKDAEVHFISRELDGNLFRKIREAGFFLHALPRHDLNDNLAGYAAWLTVPQSVDAADTKEILQELGKIDRLVVDSYALDIEWEKEMRCFVDEIFVIDDLANRRHDCDVLLEQGFRVNQAMRYEGLVSAHCKLLLGPAYALLRDEFYKVKKHLRQRDGIIRNVLVFYGGSDLTNETMKALHALTTFSLSKSKVTADVVVGTGNSHRDEVEEYCGYFPWIRYHCQVDNMAELMNSADLALGAGGTTTIERCFLGLPALVTVTAENQEAGCAYCAQLGIVECLGWHEVVTDAIILEALRGMTRDKLLMMTKSCGQWSPQGDAELCL